MYGINRKAHEKVRLPHEKKIFFFSFRPYKFDSPLKNALIFCYLIELLILPIK